MTASATSKQPHLSATLAATEGRTLSVRRATVLGIGSSGRASPPPMG